ncbi:hypothetical protein F4V43_01705 [Paenibacillus spiritus]|uniref:Uncharacterized protein n=1 Tax=Paenibacillus spiritus TaxID=2496557 RepID=A0A5J5GHP8_9BACL|nr:hypothetical protein [Paenibacillus spiritus]KAA9007228.1 hypothetical protein F4V43_01705 [Paenibacillus spiritus]
MITLKKTTTQETLLDYGFTNRDKSFLYYFKNIGFDVSFNMTIPIDLTTLKIDILDESFMQPYDYQFCLKIDPEHVLATNVKDKVEDILNRMQIDGIIEGFEEGMYI